MLALPGTRGGERYSILALRGLIEQLVAKLKALVRNAAARTRGALWATIGQLLDGFNPTECRNELANSGHAVGQPGNALAAGVGATAARQGHPYAAAEAHHA